MKKKKVIILFIFVILLATTSLSIKLWNHKVYGTVWNNNQLTKALTLEKLKSLPYLTYTEEKVNKSQIGVIRYDPTRAFGGYNLYYTKSMDINRTRLMDMEGNIIHSWPLRKVIILENGDIIGITNHTIGKYDWHSNLIWEKNLTTHHELIKTPDGTILTASKEVHKYNGMNVEFDIVLELSQEGDELSRWSTYENLNHIQKFHMPSKLDLPKFILNLPFYNKSEDAFYDYYHLNSIQSLPKTPISKNDKRFQHGNWLISLSYSDLVIILDKETKEIVWSWGPGEIDTQHMPRMLDNGNILIYDNGKLRKYTRIIELDPIKKKVVWEYKADPPESFYSAGSGSAHRLPNENTLIAEANKGRAFEVTKNGDIVWEWFNPDINEEGKRATIYRMTRIPKDKVDKLLV